MKQISIFLLTIIVLIIGYGQYNQYQRFTLENYQYQATDGVDINYHSKTFVLDYYEAIEDLNNYIITQWSANRIDVRAPESDDLETQAATVIYANKLALVKYFEGQLLQSAELKTQGMTNQDVRSFEEDGISKADKLRDAHKAKIMRMFGNVSNTVRLGDKSAFVYEIQKLLKTKGHDVTLDGVYKDLTVEAILAFETAHKLYPDGKLDIFTLEQLLD
jgi:hypothetical protein